MLSFGRGAMLLLLPLLLLTMGPPADGATIITPKVYENFRVDSHRMAAGATIANFAINVTNLENMVVWHILDSNCNKTFSLTPHGKETATLKAKIAINGPKILTCLLRVLESKMVSSATFLVIVGGRTRQCPSKLPANITDVMGAISMCPFMSQPMEQAHSFCTITANPNINFLNFSLCPSCVLKFRSSMDGVNVTESGLLEADIRTQVPATPAPSQRLPLIMNFVNATKSSEPRHVQISIFSAIVRCVIPNHVINTIGNFVCGSTDHNRVANYLSTFIANISSTSGVNISCSSSLISAQSPGGDSKSAVLFVQDKEYSRWGGNPTKTYKYNFTFDESSSTVHVSATVFNSSLHPPTCGKSLYTGTIPENAAAGALVSGGPVTAVDKDGDKVRFSWNSSREFRFDTTSGAVTTAHALSAAAGSVFNVSIHVVSGSAKPRYGQCTFRITVTSTTPPNASTTTTVKADSVQSSAFSPKPSKQSRVVFSVSMAVEETFAPALANRASPEFRRKARSIEAELTKGYQAKFPNATILVVVTGFRDGSVLTDFEVYVLTPLEITSDEKLTDEKMQAITRDILKGGSLKVVRISVQGAELSFQPLPMTTAEELHVTVGVKATTTERFQPAFETTSPDYGVTRSRIHQRLSVGFRGNKEQLPVALDIKKLPKDSSTGGTILTFDVVYKAGLNCDSSSVREAAMNAIIRADFEVLRIEISCPAAQMKLTPLDIALIAASGFLFLLMVILLIVLWYLKSRKVSSQSYQITPKVKETDGRLANEESFQ